MAEKIRILLIEPLERPRLVEIEHTLEKLHEIVGGYIQAVYPWDDPVAVVCDDEGKFKGYPGNRVLEDEDGNPYDLLVGTFFICGLTEDDFGSISDELAEKYTKMFENPEMFMRTLDGHMVMVRMGEEPRVIA